MVQRLTAGGRALERKGFHGEGHRRARIAKPVFVVDGQCLGRFAKHVGGQRCISMSCCHAAAASR